MSWLSNLLQKLFGKKPDDVTPIVTQPVTPNPTPAPVIPFPVAGKYNRFDWSVRALHITQRFEGETAWANITGNFDGAGLTCGALGWTIQWHNQQPLVKQFVLKFGIDKLKALMPQTWKWYWELTNIKSESEAIKRANEISEISSKVQEPYNTELKHFWSSEEMIQIQKEAADRDMGAWAETQATKMKAYFGLPAMSFMHFAYYFDQKVLNGGAKNPEISEGEAISTESVFRWMLSESGYGENDFNKNIPYWKGLIERASPDQKLLFRLAKIRADRAREEFDTITMSRRGILCLGSGFVNGKFWDIKKDLGMDQI